MQPAYRATVYKPRSQQSTPGQETDVLVPRAGAPHAQPFQVATMSGLAGWQPYLDLPQGRKGQIDPLAKRTDVGTLELTLIDQRLTPGGSNAIRWVTAFAADAAARNLLLGCKVFVEESLDGGATWAAFFTGRVTKASLSGKIKFVLSLREIADDLKIQIFTGSPHASITYAFRPNFLPIILPAGWGGLQPPVAIPKVHGTVTHTFADGSCEIQITAADGYANDERMLLLTKAWFAYATNVEREQLPIPVYNLTPAGRMVLTRLDTSAAGEFALGISKAAPKRGSDGAIVIWGLRAIPLASTDPKYLAAPPVGTAVAFTVEPRGVPVTEALPLFVNDVHPVQLLADILDGRFGTLDASGAVQCPIARDTAAFAALIADPSFTPVRYLVTEAATLNTWIEEYICKVANLAYFFDGQGRVVPVDCRAATARSSVATITDTDLVSTAEGEGWAQDVDQAITQAEATYYLDQQQLPSHPPIDLSGVADVPLGLVQTTAVKRRILDFSPRALDLGGKLFRLDAKGLRAVIGESSGADDRRAQLEARIDALLNELKGPYSLGPTTITLHCRRTANTGAVQGQIVTVNVSTIPNPDTVQRGGARVYRVLQRAERGPIVDLVCLDLGSATPASAPAFQAQPVANAAVPRFAIDVTVSLNAAGDPTEVWVNATDPAVAVRPADSDAGWRLLATRTVAGVFTTYGQPSGRRFWCRCRAMPTQASGLKPPSVWAYPSGSGYTDYAQTTAPAAPASVSVTSIQKSSATVSWTLPSGIYSVEVYLTTGGVPASWNPATDRLARLSFGARSYPLTGLAAGTQYTVGVLERDPFGGASAVATATFTTGAANVAAPAPRGVVLIWGLA